MEDDDFSFDFESKLEEQQKAAVQPSGAHASVPSALSGPVNQSVGSFKRNFRQTVCTYWLKGVCALGENCGFLHEYNTERMPVCKTLVKFGVCKEPDCPFKHTLEDIKECNMYKLGFCVYGPQCRYRHIRLPGPPPDPKDVEAAKPKAYRQGGRDAERPEAGRGRGRFHPYGRGRGDGGRSGPRPPRQIEAPRESPKEQPLPPRPHFQHPQMMPPMMGYGHPGMMGMPGMMPGMPMGMPMPPFWRGPPMGPGRPFPPYRFR